MLYHLLYPLHTHSAYGVFRVFRYISFRVLMAMLTALLISFLFGPALIRALKKYQIGQQIRDDGPKTHLGKSGTPTMGGILIVLSMVVSYLLWGRLDIAFSWMVLLATVGFAAIGFVDDYLKLRKKVSKGLSIRGKFKLQGLIALVVGLLLVIFGFDTHLTVPFLKDFTPHLGFVFVPFAMLVIIGASNAVNLTDGLDGLAIGPVMICALTYLIFAYVTGHAEMSAYLQLSQVRGAGEMAVFCAAMIGAGLGFLWYNTYPAQIFMGDVGSLALGAALGAVAIITKQELLLIVVGGIFVVEAVSVIVQVFTFRTMGKRVFRMAPIHHHFELKGWAEPKVIVRFWIISIILALIALATLKLR
ncbi:MAG TPA: phospho-N-acetylmuramoyl-pentapeptide-transferase [Bdellovibrionota bacterium]|nr:phospho-N-acetylmuramoyl-pentapeptide-transferase [Bdellovibrionota bacterium]